MNLLILTSSMFWVYQKEQKILSLSKTKDYRHKKAESQLKWEETKALNFTDPLPSNKNNKYFLKPDNSIISNTFTPKWTKDSNNSILEIKESNLLTKYSLKWMDSPINHGANLSINCYGQSKLSTWTSN